MKKTFAIILIALMAMTVVFAATVTHHDNLTVRTGKESAVLDVKLDIASDDMKSYSFGFASSSDASNLTDPGVTTLPEAFSGTLSMTYDPDTSIATGDDNAYFYYKVRTDDVFYLTFALDGPLHDDNNSANVDWTATFSETQKSSYITPSNVPASLTTSGSGDSLKATFTPSTSATHYGMYSISFETEEIPFLSQDANFKGTMSVTISAS